MKNNAIRYYLSILVALWLAMPAHSVLKEKDLHQTLRVLETELQAYSSDVHQSRQHDAQLSRNIRHRLDHFSQEADQIALMVYSQQEDFVFDISYACRQAWDLKQDFYSAHFPFDSIAQGQINELRRYQRLTAKLDELIQQRSDSSYVQELEACYAISSDIRTQLQLGQDHLQEQKNQYEQVQKQIMDLDSCANARYNEVLEKVIFRPYTNAHTLLFHLPDYISRLREQVNSKYSFDNDVRSQWDLKNIIFIFAGIILYALLALAIGLLLNRFFIKRKKRLAAAFRTPQYAVLFMAEVVFGLFSLFIHLTVGHHFIHMASALMYQYTGVLVLLTLSLMYRHNSDSANHGLRLYSPMMVLCFCVIIIRTMFLPVSLISMLFPLVVAACFIWQWISMRNAKQLPKGNKIVGWATFVVMGIVLALSVCGLSMFGLMLVMLWTLQMTSMLAFSCISQVCKSKEKQYKAEGKTQLKDLWVIELCDQLLVPVLYIISILWSIAWGAGIFDLGDYVYPQFKYPLVSVPDIIEISVWNLMAIAIGFFVCRYVTHIAAQLLKQQFLDGKHDNGAGAVVIGKNGISILVWGTFLVISMMSLKMGSTWIMVITGGLSTGVGFAMKDTLENLFYGISLMLGRVHIHDLIECDGIRGHVVNISYQITTIQTWDGAEIAILNSQLVSKNFKNLTRNHHFEYQVIPFSVAYGSDVAFVRLCVMQSLSRLDVIARKEELDVRFDSFGDSCVCLKVMAWVDVNNRGSAVAAIKETIYNTLNAHHIEIPFPQLDVHQR